MCRVVCGAVSAGGWLWEAWRCPCLLCSEPRHALTLVLTGWAGLQVCVVALKKGQLQVLSNAWDRDLGGRNLDLVLFEHFAK